MDKAKDKEKPAVAINGKAKNKITINPPEKEPVRNMNELFAAALDKRGVLLDAKTSIVLEAKSIKADFPVEVIQQVYVRGYTSSNPTGLTREQHAMNRVNSFIAGGAAMAEDYDLLPIDERVGLKGSGGGMRPHIKRERSPYNNKIIFHVVDAKGTIKHTTGDEVQAKQHLATNYNKYLGEARQPANVRMYQALQREREKWDREHKLGQETMQRASDEAKKREQEKEKKVNEETINERFKTAAWSRKEGKNPEGGLNRKGIASYRARNPGSKLSMAVTTKPSKLKPGSKAANRRKSFCARMGGVDGPMKKPNGEPTRKALALRKWNC